MQSRKIFWLFALLSCSPAFGDFELKTLVEAVEASPSNIILPATTNGMMTYRGCSEECDKEYRRARLTESTSFIVGGEAMKFADFRIIHTQLKRTEGAYSLVTIDLESGTVTNITMER